jgi:hypothetical protein
MTRSTHPNEDRVHETLKSIIALFESGKAPEAIAHLALPCPDIPASKWSFGNNLLLWIADTGDARGFRQWQEVERNVRKGSHAIYILAPIFKRINSKRDESEPVPAGDSGDKRNDIQNMTGKSADSKRSVPQILGGFRAVPVFRFEDTEGKPLQNNLTPNEPPPLIEVAEQWGLSVRYVGCSGNYLGYYRHNPDRAHEIALATHDEQVFFHELAHAAQYRVWTDIQPNQTFRKEVAAETAACVLARLYGRKSPNEGASFQYVKTYCESNGKPLGKHCGASCPTSSKSSTPSSPPRTNSPRLNRQKWFVFSFNHSPSRRALVGCVVSAQNRKGRIR